MCVHTLAPSGNSGRVLELQKALAGKTGVADGVKLVAPMGEERVAASVQLSSLGVPRPASRPSAKPRYKLCRIRLHNNSATDQIRRTRTDAGRHDTTEYKACRDARNPPGRPVVAIRFGTARRFCSLDGGTDNGNLTEHFATRNCSKKTEHR